MKKISIMLVLSVIASILFCGCSSSDNKNTSSDTSSDSAAYEDTSVQSVQSSFDGNYISDDEAISLFARYMTELYFDSLEDYSKNFTDDSDKELISQSYNALHKGMEYADQRCIAKDNGVYYFLFKLSEEDQVQASLIPLYYKDERFYAKLNSDTINKGNEIMQDYICRDCEGKGTIIKDGMNTICDTCEGFGIIFS